MAVKKKIATKLKNAPLALRLEPYRKAFGWSQAELGNRLGVSDASINRIEGGDQNWNQEFLQNAAKALETDWLDLLPLPGAGTVLDVWAEIPANERDRALAALRIFTRKSAA